MEDMTQTRQHSFLNKRKAQGGEVIGLRSHSRSRADRSLQAAIFHHAFPASIRGAFPAGAHRVTMGTADTHTARAIAAPPSLSFHSSNGPGCGRGGLGARGRGGGGDSVVKAEGCGAGRTGRGRAAWRRGWAAQGVRGREAGRGAEPAREGSRRGAAPLGAQATRMGAGSPGGPQPQEPPLTPAAATRAGATCVCASVSGGGREAGPDPPPGGESRNALSSWPGAELRGLSFPSSEMQGVGLPNCPHFPFLLRGTTALKTPRQEKGCREMRGTGIQSAGPLDLHKGPPSIPCSPTARREGLGQRRETLCPFSLSGH
jgi:hypothetical protein